MGRPRSCECGSCEKCRRREVARQRYQALSVEERKAFVARRDPDLVRASDRARYYRAHAQRKLLMKLWAAQNPERSQELKREHAARYPDRTKARNAVGNAIRDGRLVRGACEVCGAAQSQAHHDDYSKPLDVRWLCTEHHGVQHRRAA